MTIMFLLNFVSKRQKTQIDFIFFAISLTHSPVRFLLENGMSYLEENRIAFLHLC